MIFNYKLKGILTILSFLIVLVLFLILRNFFLKMDLFSILSFSGVIFVFFCFDLIFNINFKLKYYVYVLLVAFFGFFFGFLTFYIPYYNRAMHFLGPFFLCSLIFFVLSKRGYNKKESLFFVFFISVAILGIHELIEYFIDIVFNMNLQGVGLGRIDDTMIDLFMGVLGSLTYILFGFLKRNNYKTSSI